jgi:hypothetical protein
MNGHVATAFLELQFLLQRKMLPRWCAMCFAIAVFGTVGSASIWSDADANYSRCTVASKAYLYMRGCAVVSRCFHSSKCMDGFCTSMERLQVAIRRGMCAVPVTVRRRTKGEAPAVARGHGVVGVMLCYVMLCYVMLGFRVLGVRLRRVVEWQGQ